MDKKILKGWLAALFSVLVLWGLNNVMIGYSAKVLEVNYLIYTCCAFISASFMLLLAGGLKDDLAKETLRSPDTLMFGFIMLFGYLITLSLFFYTSSTEGAFLQRISMIFSLLTAWFFMQRKPSIPSLVGALLVLFGIGLICQEIPAENRGMIYLIMFLEGAALTARTFAAETHKSYTKAIKEDNDPKLKTRVVGFVMFLVSMVFLIFSLMFAALQTYFPVFENSSIVPVLSDFVDYKTIFAGLFAGIVLITPLRLIEFFSANTIKSENFLALAALSPFATLFWEWLFEPLTGISIKDFSTNDLIAGLIITFGCLLTAFAQIIKTRTSGVEVWREFVKEYDENDLEVYNSKEIVEKTLNHYNQNYKQAAESLGVSKCTIHKISDNKNYGFRDSITGLVMANFKEYVANIDYLTKIYNRSGFEKVAEEFMSSTDLFTLMFIDLDKFKPVNDKYGHEMGDFVLKKIASRLIEIENSDIKICRLAGDEFVILFRNYEKSHILSILHLFEQMITKPIELPNKKSVKLEASFGVSEYESDSTNLTELLDIADKNMYKHKKQKI